MSLESSINLDDSNSKKIVQKSKSTFGLIGIGLFGGLAAGIVALTLPFVSPGFRRVVLPYVPATNVQIDNVLQALKHSNNGLKNTKKLIDLGSGDGRIVIECAKHGIKSYGVELNLWLVLFSKFNSLRMNVHNLTSFKRKNLFKVNLSEYDKIIIFGVDSLMPLIEDKIQKDYSKTNKSTSLIVCRFPFTNWEPVATFGHAVDQVWLYEYPYCLSQNKKVPSNHQSVPIHTIS